MHVFFRPVVLIAALIVAAAAAFPQQREEPRAAPPPEPFYPNEVFNIWPGVAPDEDRTENTEYMLVERRRPFYQLAEVSIPTLAAYLPDADKATGAAVLVIPGGGLVRLAIEHEGYEIARWLRENGVAAFVLKHRIPGVGRQTRWKKGVQDAQRAMSIIRSRADEWGIDVDGIGAIGFSAGAEIGTRISLSDERQYAPVDATDDNLVRPAFMLNIYPGGLAGGFRGNPPAVRADVLAMLDEQAPPMFFAHAISDASLNSIMMTLEMKKKGLPAELHIFQDGAHGFGARESGAPLNAWRDLALAWMDSLGYLDSREVRAYPEMLLSADRAGQPLPRITASSPSVTFDDAYRSQKRIAARLGMEVGGYKGAMSSAGAMASYRMSAPVNCILDQEMIVQASELGPLSLAEMGPTVVETELGYIMGVDIPTKIADPEEARLASEAVVAALDVTTNMPERMPGVSAIDFAAANCGSKAKIIIGERIHPDDYKIDDLPITLSRNGKQIHETSGAVSKGGQWVNLITLINQIIDQGHIIHQGDLIISGVLGPPYPAEPGKYSADYGPLGKVEFELR